MASIVCLIEIEHYDRSDAEQPNKNQASNKNESPGPRFSRGDTYVS